MSTVSAQPPYKYKICVKTGDKEGAGTDAKVWIQLWGTKHSTNWILLDQPGRNDFERDHVDDFEYNSHEVDLGTIGQLALQFDHSNPAADWFLDSIWIQTPQGQKTKFTYDYWLKRPGDNFYPKFKGDVSHVPC